MSANFVWIIEWMKNYPEYENLQNVVYEIGWRCNASEAFDGKDYGATRYGSVQIAYNQNGTFVAYEDLTEEIVLGWLYENGVNKQESEQALQDQITAQIAPAAIELPLPWVA